MKKKLNCVLLIDDDEPTNYYNSLIIEETGCADHVQVVQSGQKALEYLTNSEHYAGVPVMLSHALILYSWILICRL